MTHRAAEFGIVRKQDQVLQDLLHSSYAHEHTTAKRASGFHFLQADQVLPKVDTGGWVDTRGQWRYRLGEHTRGSDVSVKLCNKLSAAWLGKNCLASPDLHADLLVWIAVLTACWVCFRILGKIKRMAPSHLLQRDTTYNSHISKHGNQNDAYACNPKKILAQQINAQKIAIKNDG